MSTSISSPTPPQAPTASESAKAWADAQPQIYQQQLEYAPKEAQMQLDLAQKYALPYAEIFRNAQATLYPELSALNEQLSSQASAGAEQGLTDAERSDYMDYFNANLGTNAGSAIGANYVANNLTQLDTQRKDYYRNLGLSLSGRQPLAQPSTPQTSNYMAGFTPNSVMGFNAQNYGNYSSAWGQGMDAQGRYQLGMNQMYGRVAGSALGGLGTFMGG